MRILLILEAALGGVGRHVLDLARGLLDHGHQVNLIYSPVRADQRFLIGIGDLVAEQPNFSVTSFSIDRELGASDFRWWWRISQHLRQRGPFDVIHCHSTKAGFLGRLGLGKKRARVIYTPHSLMMLNPSVGAVRRILVGLLERSLSKLCNNIVIISIAEWRVAEQGKLPRNKLVSIPNGVRTGEFRCDQARWLELRSRMGVSPDEVAVGIVGRLCYDKDPELALQAFALASKQSPRPLVLVVMGAGPHEATMQALAKRLNIDRSIRWLGMVDAPSHIPGLDLLLHSSRFEGLSYVFLECLASGVPIVTTRVGGVEELITDGETGFVSASRDPNDLCAPLLAVANDIELRTKMSNAARLRARQFEFEAMLEGVLKLYSAA